MYNCTTNRQQKVRGFPFFQGTIDHPAFSNHIQLGLAVFYHVNHFPELKTM